MELVQRISQLEGDLKLLKNEIKEVLLGLEEVVLREQNPFSIPNLARSPAFAPESEANAPHSYAVKMVKNVEPRDGPGIVVVEEGPVDGDGGEGPQGGAPALESWGEVLDGAAPVQGNGVAHGPAPAPASGVQFYPLLAMATWAERTVRRIGRESADTIIQLYELRGSISPVWRDVMTMLLDLAETGVLSDKIRSRQAIAALVQLQGILSPDLQTQQIVFWLSEIEDQGASDG